jgi:hypothetical protein
MYFGDGAPPIWTPAYGLDGRDVLSRIVFIISFPSRTASGNRGAK